MRTPFCIFCAARGPLTEEHIVSKWISETLKAGDPTVQYLHQRGPGDGTGYSRDFVAKRIELAPRVVCGGQRYTCNNNWMSALEAEMQKVLPPMFAGYPCELSVPVQRRIAAWAMMKFMVAEHTAPSRDRRFFSQTEREEFRRTQTPPKGSFIWLANYSIGNAAARSLGRHVPWSGGGYVGILGAGRLLVLLVSHKRQPAIRVRPDLDHFSTQVWPPLRAATWPPSGQFNDTAVEDFFSAVPAVPA